MKILVVDPSVAERAAIGRHIEHLGGTAVMASHGLEALELFAEEIPDMVLLDVVLPDISGYEVARRIRASETAGNWTPIIFVTARSRDEDVEQGIAAGGDDYLHKPVSRAVLSAKIRAMHRIVQMRTSLLVMTRQLDAANQELVRLSSSDGLTGIPNRRYFDETLNREWRRSRRNSSALALIMCDVDHFKRFNDLYGHQTGDECLRRVARVLTQASDRGGDIPARYGGEEFSVILPDTSIDGAGIVAEKAREAVIALDIPHAQSPYGVVTISLGVASLIPDETGAPETLILAADQALYQAKHEGRNRVWRHAGHKIPAKAL
ncbi:MAG: diguanylate cyclase domain-containing protein [Betaproteobacteria bacterium]